MSSLLRTAIRKNRDLVWFSVLALLFAGGPSTMASIFNVHRWYHLQAVHVSDGPSFNDLTVVVEREIRRPFLGSFRVTVWPTDMSAPICTGKGDGINYKPTTVPIISKDAEWLMGEQTPPKCSEVLGPGEYIANVVVTVHPSEAFLWWMPDPHEDIWSNVFHITEGTSG